MNPSRLRVLGCLAPVLLLLLIALPSARAGNATWNLDPVSEDWNTAVNWIPNIVPNGPADRAIFDVSSTTSVSLSANTEVDRIVFKPGASKFTITAEPDVTLTISGSGVVNNSGVQQEFVILVKGGIFVGNENSISFTNNATAGEDNLFTARPGSDGGAGGATRFHNLASAAGSSFVNEGAAAFSAGATTQFYDSSTAASGDFANEAALEGAAGSGRTQFFDSATAGSGTFTNKGGIAVNAVGGNTEFFDTSSAGNSTLTGEGGSPNGGIGSGGAIFFFDDSSADHCTIISNGGNGPNAFGGGVLFQGTSTAGNATLIANGGVNGGRGASIGLKTDGGAARIEVFGNGFFDSGGAIAPVTVGSIEGDGTISAARDNLIVGSNDLSTTFSGIIRDLSLTKIGQGTLVLSGTQSTYTGGTVVSAGGLEVSNTAGSATGTGTVRVDAGTLSGGGIIAGTVTIGAGNGAGAFLAPGQNASKTMTLTIQRALTFKADATYTYGLKTKRAEADKVIANGVTIESGAQFSFKQLANKTLTAGTAFTAISNTAATPISGTFANLPDDSTVTVGRNTFQADYQGGDGNDLTLTVVPRGDLDLKH